MFFGNTNRRDKAKDAFMLKKNPTTGLISSDPGFRSNGPSIPEYGPLSQELEILVSSSQPQTVNLLGGNILKSLRSLVGIPANWISKSSVLSMTSEAFPSAQSNKSR